MSSSHFTAWADRVRSRRRALRSQHWSSASPNQAAFRAVCWRKAFAITHFVQRHRYDRAIDLRCAFNGASQRGDGHAGANTGVAESNTALQEQGRHLPMKGGWSYVAYAIALQPCNPCTLAMHCSSGLPGQIARTGFRWHEPAGSQKQNTPSFPACKANFRHFFSAL